MDRIFDFVDLSVGDHEVATFEYVGTNDIKCKTCVVGVTQLGCSFLGAFTATLNPIGVFVVNVNDVVNPLEYANGSDPQHLFIRSFRSEVFRIGDVVLIQFERPQLAVHESVKRVLEMTEAEQVIVLSSMPKEEFVGNVEAPKLFALSTREEEAIEILPAPNSVRNVSAGLLTLGALSNRHVRVLHIVEGEDSTMDQAMKLWMNEMGEFLPITNVDELAHNAALICKRRNLDRTSLYL